MNTCKFATRFLGAILTVCSIIAGGCATRVSPTIGATELPLHSSGSSLNSRAWSLDQNGYVGGYLRVSGEGNKKHEVTVIVSASSEDQGKLGIVVADQKATFDVESSAAKYGHTFELPAGTYFLRVELSNNTKASPRRLTIQNVAVDGAELLKESTDALALASANTYIEHFRKGNASVSVPDLKPGTSVHVKLVRNEFGVGGNIHGASNLPLVADNPKPGSDIDKFQKFATSHFTTVVVSNGGKWAYNEKERGKVTMEYIDAYLRFCAKYNLRARMHTMLWDNPPQTPDWVNDLLARGMTDPAAKKDLRDAISQRIGYYIKDRAKNIVEMDILNEAYHKPSFWKLFGPEGVADIFKEAQAAVESAGGKTRLYLNEFNILQWSQQPPYDVKDAPYISDPYANWYRGQFEQVLEAGGPVNGIGVQYYADMRPDAIAKSPHSPARMAEVFQNLSITGLPISLTEFGVGKDATREQAADIFEDTIRTVYGTPNTTTFLFFGFWEKAMWDQAPGAYLVDKDWNLTPAGKRFEKLMNEWSTDLTTTVGRDGKVHFTGYYGDYDLTAGDKTIKYTFEKH